MTTLDRITPLDDNLLVRLLHWTELRGDSRVYVPRGDPGRGEIRSALWAVVIKAGPGKKVGDTWLDAPAKPGDHVAVAKFQGTEFVIDGEKYLILMGHEPQAVKEVERCGRSE